MKITDILKQKKVTVSCELFPPKAGTALEDAKKVVRQMAETKPAFMSVTYGAGGGNSENTVSIAEEIQNVNGITALAHLTCVNKGGFCVGGACYPEGHPESQSLEKDIWGIRQKVESGCQFLTTQMFFDNNILYNFMFRLLKAGVDVPVIAGIMPVTNSKQITRICSLSGTALPPRFRAIVDKFADNPAAMRQAGIAYATEQIIDLIANGVNHIHIYSMNKPDIAGSIMRNLSEMIG